MTSLKDKRIILKLPREKQQIFKVMKRKDLQPRLLYPVRLSFKIEGEIMSFQTRKS